MNALLFSLALAAPAQPPLPAFPPPVDFPAAALPPAVTLDEFARGFRPMPGIHSIWLIHPKTNAPVFISFTLPPGVPKVHRSSRHVEFDYGKKEVEVRFLNNGSVRVEY